MPGVSSAHPLWGRAQVCTDVILEMLRPEDLQPLFLHDSGRGISLGRSAGLEARRLDALCRSADARNVGTQRARHADWLLRARGGKMPGAWKSCTLVNCRNGWGQG